MPLNTPSLENKIFDIFWRQYENIDENQDPKVAIRNIAKDIALAVQDYVTGGDVNTVGTATAQKGKMT